MDLGLQDRVAFVAGASSGLGRAVARRLISEGAKVAICSRDADRIADAAQGLRSETGVGAERVLGLVCDVTREDDIAEAIGATVDHFGALHILVTNAGGPPAGFIDDFDAQSWRDALELNLMSTVNLSRHALQHLRRAADADGHARIVMVSSVSAKQPIPSLYLSNTARAGVQGFAKSLAEELGPTGITVNTVLPGYTRTDRLQELGRNTAERTGEALEEVEAGWAEQNALKRLGEPGEFADAVAFLASERAAYITGVALPVDGGRVKHIL